MTKRRMLGMLVALLLPSIPAQANPEDVFTLRLYPVFSVENDVDILLLPGITTVAVLADGGDTGAAQGDAVVSQSVVGNTIVENEVHHSNEIVDSFRDGVGIFDFNQDNGNSNNQANVRAFALSRALGLGETEITTYAERHDNSVESTGGSRSNRVEGSYNDTVGVAGLNQSAGNANIQTNVLVAAIGLDVDAGATLLTDSTLSAVLPTPTDLENAEDYTGVDQPRSDTFVDSFVGYKGVAQVSMTSGDLNVSQNVMGISYVPLGGLP